MGPAESKRLAFHGYHGTTHGGAVPGHVHSAHGNDGDLSSPANHLAGDVLEGALTNWESAWIDLGGEG
jgi:hypothetical protein